MFDFSRGRFERLFHFAFGIDAGEMELLEFGGGLGLRFFVRNLAGVTEHIAIGQAQEIIQLGNPVTHRHRPAVPGLQFGKFELGRDDEIQGVEFILTQVVLGNAGVGMRQGLAALRTGHVKPMFGRAASARAWTISAAVCPWAAQGILFCTMAKKRWRASAEES